MSAEVSIKNIDNNKKTASLVSGTIMFLFLGLIYAWSIFRGPLTEVFPGWTPTRISFTFTLSIAFFCIGGFISGRLSAKIAHRTIIRLSAVLILVSFILITLLLDPGADDRSLYVLYIFYGVLGGAGIGLAYNATLGAVTKWFPDKAGMASGILLFGYGLGGLVLGSIVNFLTEMIGIINVFAVIGVILAVVLFSLSFLIRIPDGPMPGLVDRGGSGKQDYTLSEALKTPTFWAFALWVMITSIAGLLVVNSAANIAVYFGAPAVLGLIVPGFNGVGRVALGIAHDHFGRPKAMMMNNSILLAGGFLLLFGASMNGAALIFVGLPLIGLAYGGIPPLSTASMMGLYGQKHFAIIFAALTFAILPAAIIGPLISSRLQEISGGSYHTTFIMLIVVGFITIALTLMVGVQSRRSGLE